MPGRGAYVCRDAGCVGSARKRLARALRLSGPLSADQMTAIADAIVPKGEIRGEFGKDESP